MVSRLAGLAAVSLLALVSGANAATVDWGAPVVITFSTSAAGSCNATGNGNPLNGNGSDPLNLAGYLTLDTTSSLGVVPLTIQLGSSGNFSFAASAFYTDYVLGIQTEIGRDKPDYFSFNLPAGVFSGSYLIKNSNDVATGAVLYGHSVISASPVPGPIVGAGLPGIVMAIGGFVAWRRRRNQAAAA